MSQFNKQNSPSWSVTAGTLLLAASSFMGCAKQEIADIPYETQLAQQTMKAIPAEEIIATQSKVNIAQNPDYQVITDQLTRVDAALGLARSSCNEYGWKGSLLIRDNILSELKKTETIILDTLKKEGPNELSSSLERIYESVSVTHNLLEDNRLTTGCLRGRDATNGTMHILYGARAQIKLALQKLTESQ
jgi:hypothetical protein